MHFYEGQLVKCVDAIGAGVGLCAGKIYEIEELLSDFDERYVRLKEFPNHDLRQNRFIPMDMQSTSPYCRWEMKWKLYGQREVSRENHI